MANDFGLLNAAPPSGLQGFGNVNYGLLAPETVAQLQQPRNFPGGTYGQALPADFARSAPKPGDYYDPYYNLRNIPGLLDNPNFSWLKQLDTGPMNIALPAQVVPGTETGKSKGGLGGLTEGWKEKADRIKDLFDLSANVQQAPISLAGVANQFDLSDPNTWVGQSRGKLNEWEDNFRQTFSISDPNAPIGEIKGKINEWEDNLRQGLNINKVGNVNTYTKPVSNVVKKIKSWF
jgi:hypothetical protein